METKKCARCEITKSISLFSRRKAAKDGLETKCKPCDAERQKERRNSEQWKQYVAAYQLKNKEHRKEYEKQRRTDEKYREYWKEYNKEYYLTFKGSDAQKQQTKRCADRLTDSYIRSNLTKKRVPITEDTIALQRQIINRYRTIKQLQDETK